MSFNVSLQTTIADCWQWLPDVSGGYYVRGSYEMINSQTTRQTRLDLNLVWHKQVPLKVSIFAWHLLCDRLPTKSNLATRGVLSLESRQCVFGCGQVEDACPLFLRCPIVGMIWPILRSWIGFQGVDSQDILEHFT